MTTAPRFAANDAAQHLGIAKDNPIQQTQVGVTPSRNSQQKEQK